MTITIDRRSFIQGADLLSPQHNAGGKPCIAQDCRSQSRLDCDEHFAPSVGNCHQMGEIPECVAAFRR